MTYLYLLFALCVLVSAFWVYWWGIVFPGKLVIRDEATGEPYLTRYHLANLRGWRWLPSALRKHYFLHHIWREDKDRDYHNHPWPESFSIVLWGGYCENRLGDPQGHILAVKMDTQWWQLPPWRAVHIAPAINELHPGTYHRITYVKPNTWTLFIAGERTREWGFLVDGKHVDWREYLGLPMDTDLGD